MERGLKLSGGILRRMKAYLGTKTSFGLYNLLRYTVLTLALLTSLLGSAADLFWVGGSGNWSDAAHWSNSSGGTGGAGIPGSQDVAHFDQNSSLNSQSIVTIGTDISIAGLHWSFNGGAIEASGHSILISQELNFQADIQRLEADQLIFEGSGSHQLTTADQPIDADVIFNGGNWSLNGALLLSGQNIALTKGGLSTNGHPVLADRFMTRDEGFARTLDISGSQISVMKGWDFEDGINFNATGSIVYVNHEADPADVKKGSLTYDQFVYDASIDRGAIPCGAFTFDLVLDTSYNGSDVSCNGEEDGAICVEIISGPPSGYTFTWLQFPGESGMCVDSIGAGTYDVLVSDGTLTCPATISLADPSNLAAINFTSTPPTCNGSCDGEGDFIPFGGTVINYPTDYIVVWNGGETNEENTIQANQLCTGINTLTLEDLNGCTFDTTFNIAVPTPVYTGVTIENVSCFGVCDGYAISNPGGGNGAPYTWDWSTTETTDSIGGLCAGSYTLHVEDVNGCPGDTTFNVTTPLQLVIDSLNQVNLLCNNVCIGEIAVTTTNGTTPYSYQWFDNTTGLPIAGQTDSLATGLCAGDYFVEVTDANGCTETSQVFTITEPTPVNSTVNETDVLCFGDCNGIGSASASGGTPGYTYEWFDIGDNSQGTGVTINTLCAGDFYVVATDANSCPDTTAFTIGEPDEITTTTGQVDLLCNSDCIGEAGVVPAGGVGSYTYEWFSTPPDAIIAGETNDTIQGLCAGDYFAIVTDANGCDDTTTNITITEPPALTLTTAITDILCNGDCNGEIDADVSGGVAPYTAQWFDCNTNNPIAGETDTLITGLCPGSYYIEITDDNGCTIDNSGNCDVLNDPPQLDISITNTIDASCGGFCDGGATATVSGGTGNTTVTWHSSIDDSQQGAGTTINTLCVGTYYAVATDDNGCSDTTAIFPITDVANVTGTVNVFDASCFGVCDGAASIDATGGTPPYTYEWIRLSDGANIGAADSVSSLCAGDYTVQVFDANNCNSPAYAFTINENPEIFANVSVTDVSCFGECDGSATVNASGGSGGFGYTWTPAPGAGQGTATPSQLCPGTYQLAIVDAAGCPFDTSIVINEPVPFDVSATVTDETCSGDCDGTATAIVNSGGTAPFTYTWSPAPGAGQGTPNPTGLCPGIYDLTVTDANGCDTTLQVEIEAALVLDVTANVISQNICPGGCDGSANALITGGTTPYNITWSPAPGGGQGTTTATGLCAGNYTVNVVDDNGCTASDNVNITEPADFDIDTSSTNNQCNGDCDGTATVLVNSGGTGSYSYSWDDPFSQTTPTAVGLCAGTYTVTVTDQNACDTSITFTISEPPAISASVTSNNSSCFGACDGSITINISGGVPGYTVNWFNAVTGNPILGMSGPSVNNLCPGDFFAEITDANGCSVQTNIITVTEEQAINLSESTVPATCPNCDGQATITATGGTGNFVDYQWTPAPGSGQGTPTGTNMCTGLYQVVVIDDIGCSDTINVAISDFPIDTITVSSTDVTCFGGSDGEATATVTCTDPACNLEWFNQTTGSSLGTANPITGLTAGDYFAQVTNASGCVTIEQFTINESAPIDASPTFTNPSCAGSSDGTASVSPTGGAGGFTFNWSPNPPGGQGTNTATGLSAGSWSVTITDGDGCDTTVSVTLSDPTPLDVSNVTSSNISCNGDADGTATVFPTGGSAPYTYEWFECASGAPIGQTGQQATGLGPGDYFVVVTDGTGCAEQSNCVSVTEPAPLAGALSSMSAVCNGDCSGEGYVVPSGGNMNYQYQWLDDFFNPIPGETNDTITGLCPGTYHLQLSDLNGCSTVESSITITEPAAFDVSISSTDVDCFSACNGTATAVVNSGGTAPYSFNWNPAPGSGQGTGSASSMCAGTYDLTITDGAGCDTVIQVTINEPQELLFNVTVTDIVCNADCNGDIQTSVTGGSAPYTYSWSTGDATPGISGLCDGTYTVTILDAAGCQADTTITLNEPTVINALTGSNDASCNLCNGSASVSPTGGYGTPFTYSWSPAPGGGQGTQNATSLCAGIYTVDVTDAGGCTVQFTIPVNNIGAEVLTTDSTDAQCFDICDGTATVNFTCSDPPCQVEWFDAATGNSIGQTTNTATGLCGGDYYAQVVNASGCISVEPVTVDAPTELEANETITPVSCAGQSDGSITVAVTGGAGGYTYNWSPVPPNGNGTPNATGLAAGSYDLTVTDADGCDSTFTFTLTDPTSISVTSTVTDVLCNGDCNGIISAQASGGQIPYTYQWQDASQTNIPGETNNMITNQCAGDYFIVVTDANGCAVSEGPITINEPTTMSSTISGTDVLCNGQCDGEATVTPSGGTAPYNVTWFDSGTGSPIGQTGTTATGLCAGDYFAIITDANNCTFTTTDQTINEPNAITATTSSTDANCNGVCDGTASVTPNGGTPTYLFEWLDASGTPVSGGGSQNVTGLCAGSYTVEVTDQNGCSTGQLQVDIFQPQSIQGTINVNDANCGINDGSATVTASGGSSPYSYQWLDDQLNPLAGETNPTLANIGAGTYFVEVTDAAGCTETFQANVGNLNGADISIDAITNVSCNGDCDGSIDVTVTGNNPPFNYVWNPGGFTQPDITGLCAGTYTLQVTDALGCISFNDTTITENPALDGTFSTVDAACGLCDGEATVTATGGAGGYTYDWTTGATTPGVTGLCAGTYSVLVTDADGCSETLTVGITNTGGPTGENVSVTGPTCAGYCDADVTVTPIGGTPPYTYYWTHDGSTTNSISGLCAGTYFLQVTDSLGCIRTVEVEIADPAGMTVDGNITPATCGLCDGEATATVNGGTSPYSYLWGGGQTTPNINGLCEGVYLVEVTDAAGCVDTAAVNVNGASAPQVVLTPTDATCSSVCDGSIDSDTTGGSQPMTYQWLDDQGNPIAGETNSSITGLCDGDYMLQVTDAAGCIATSQATVDAPTAFQFSLPAVFDATCAGTCDGEANAIVVGGTLPYAYDWSPDPGAGDGTFNATGLCAGTYDVEVTDGNGCVDTQQVTVNEPIPVVITIDSIQDALCLNTNDGAIFITASGGTPGYAYDWTTDPASSFTSTDEDPDSLFAQTYIVTVTDANGCTAMDTAQVDTQIVVLADAGPDTLLCPETSIDLIGQGTGSSNLNYAWLDTAGNVLSTDSLLTVQQTPGTYTFIFEAADGTCAHQDTVVVTVATNPDVDAGDDVSIVDGETVVIGGDPTTTSGGTIAWEPAQWLDDSTLANPTSEPDSTITYIVTVVDTNGCSNADTIEVEVLPFISFPNGFSPNGDGVNDTWQIDLLNEFPESEVWVYNRWGELLFYSLGYKQEWDGRFNNKPLPVGTYYYVIKLNHPLYPEPYTGPITILR